MTPFESLLIGHILGDWIFSNGWFATHKHKLNHIASWLHATINGISAAAMGTLTELPFITVFLTISITHLLIDTRKPIRWFMKVTGKDNLPWLVIVIDQMVHILVIATLTYTL